MDFDTGKYAAFIWPAFGITFVVLAGIVVDSLWRAGHWRREAERLQAEKDARKKAAPAKAAKP
jgi:heme exporter protein D